MDHEETSDNDSESEDGVRRSKYLVMEEPARISIRIREGNSGSAGNLKN